VPGQTAPTGGRSRAPERIGDAAIAPAERALSLDLAAQFTAQIRPEIFELGINALHLLRHDLLFAGNMIVPATPQGARRRLMVREFERHFGDFDITDQTPIGKVTRPGIVERLVCAREFYVLGYTPDEAPDTEIQPTA
jgi:hypothetical protein